MNRTCNFYFTHHFIANKSIDTIENHLHLAIYKYTIERIMRKKKYEKLT